MKRLVVFCLLLNAVLLMAVWKEIAAVAQEKVATRNGDCNGDGELDLTDAVYTLEHLFLGGPAPVALAADNAVEDRLAAVEAKLSHVTMTTVPDGQGQDVPTLRVTGANVEIRNGEGATGTANGAGNLIIGYNFYPTETEPDRTGSHNLILGTQNNYTHWGAIVGGFRNSSTARYATVLGGQEQSADGDWQVLGIELPEDITPELLGRLDTLETTVAVFPDFLDRVETLETAVAGIDTSRPNTAFFATTIRARFDPDFCDRGALVRGPGTWVTYDSPTEGSIIGLGEVTEDAIIFETDRATTLDFDIDAGPSVFGSFAVFLDDQSRRIFSIGPQAKRRVVVPDVPPGQHRLTVESSCTCSNSPYDPPDCWSLVDIRSLVISYLD